MLKKFALIIALVICGTTAPAFADTIGIASNSNTSENGYGSFTGTLTYGGTDKVGALVTTPLPAAGIAGAWLLGALGLVGGVRRRRRA